MEFLKWLLVLSCACTVEVLSQEAASFVQSLVQFFNEGVQDIDEDVPDKQHLQDRYDFVVVGAGSAGCLLASRLTEVNKWSVLLIEAGGSEVALMDVPLAANFLQNTEINWKYKTVPSEEACVGLTDRQCLYPRGKVMGGTSVLNYMVYTRGNRRDYDHWEKLGNTGWGYKDVLGYFKKSEDMTIPELAKDKEYHKTGGYMTLSNIPYRTPLAEAFVAAGVETGAPIVDYNGKTQTGFSYLQSTMKNGTRWSSSRAFLRPIRGRKNLHVTKRSMVSKILIDKKTKIAYGVEFTRGNKKYVVHATKEVIISAGAINSPQLLMVSGIGPKEHLREMNIPVVKDLKVGYNLQDHVSIGGLTFLVNESLSLTLKSLVSAESLGDYVEHHTGPWTVPGATEALAFYDLQNPEDVDGYPDLELFFASGSTNSNPFTRLTNGLTLENYNAVFKPYEYLPSYSILPMLLRPKSRGRVMLSDRSPYTKPLIYHNYFDIPEDLDTIVAGIRKSIELSKTNAFQKYNSTLLDIPFPACSQHEFNSDEYWKCAVREFTFTLYHQSGTCKMGPSSDPDAVVDPRLKVHGVRGLRVIDASIIPVIPAAHTNAPTYMIAEKGADMIKQDYGARVS